MANNWYQIKNIDEIDSPSLVVYPERVKENIRILKTFVTDIHQLRPHVKTHKSADITKIFIEAGINKFKCATIAEAEMLAMAGAEDVLLAYQPVGPKAERLAQLVQKYPAVLFACLIDNLESAKHISNVFSARHQQINAFIDLNVGMNRTGINPENASQFFLHCEDLTGISITGLHAYDGHLRDPDLSVRTHQCNIAFAPVEALKKDIQKKTGKQIKIIAGGTPTFPIHAKRNDIECSPGTFVYWDKGYESILPEQPFLFAALVVTRIISRPDETTLCVDLGHKSIASENNLDRRISFLNAPELQPIGHSEEHMVLKAPANNPYNVGDVLYGVPYHVCPTVALHDEAVVISGHVAGTIWSTTSRKRKLTI
jgi:D-serine deaminase-like pyridoxal phosphate-dependent protein